MKLYRISGQECDILDFSANDWIYMSLVNVKYIAIEQKSMYVYVLDSHAIPRYIRRSCDSTSYMTSYSNFVSFYWYDYSSDFWSAAFDFANFTVSVERLY